MENSLRQLVQAAIVRLRQADIDEPEREAYRLLALALDAPSMEALWARPPEEGLSDSARKVLDDWVGRRVAGEPLAYLTRRREFFGLSLFTPPGVLIPRPETEHVVETVLSLVTSDTVPPRPLTVVDVGCGSGAIALALRHAHPEWHILATDRYCWPLLVTAINSYRLNLPISWMLGDLLEWDAANLGLPIWTRGRFDVVCANLPYIGVEEVHGMSVETRFEPPTALFAEDHGLQLIKRLVQQAPERLGPGGFLCLEVGTGQASLVRRLMSARGFAEIEVRRDLAGIPRVVYGRWPEDFRSGEAEPH
jgi:release factor glutamine methyltransferase